MTWRDICTNGIDIKRYRMQSKVILTVTSGLILVPTVYFFFFELAHLPLVTCLYESASAVGTVGLTLGITPELGAISKLILIAQMYISRVGGLTLIFAILPATKNTLSKLPVKKISVG